MDDSYDAISLNHVDHPARLEGFSSVEKEGRWTDGALARIELPITPEWTDQICVDLDVKAFVRPDTGYQSVFLRTSHGVRSHTHKQDSQSVSDLIHSPRRGLIWRGSI
nr:hypothetical protein [Novosphingobium panipatense]